MPEFLHAHLAQAYHLAQRLAASPLWRAPLAALLAAGLARLAGRGRLAPALMAGLGVLAGWLAVVLPGPLWAPHAPVQRLAIAGLILLLAAWIAGRQRRLQGLGRFALAVLLAWWLRGAPLEGPGIANTVPWALGMWAALTIARRLAAKDTGAATLAASGALAASLFWVGAPAHWWRAAAVPGVAGLALLGVPDAAPLLVQAVLVAGLATIAASDRGRFLPVDLAVLAPFLVWWSAPRALTRLNRAGPLLAGLICAALAVAAIAGGCALFGLR